MPLRSARRVIQVVIAGLAVCLLAGVVVSCERPSAPPRQVHAVPPEGAKATPVTVGVGFHDPETYFMSDAQMNQTFDLMSATGATYVRLMIPWAGVERVQDEFDWTKVDETVKAASARKLTVVAVVNASPAWAVAPNVPAIIGRPASAGRYADFCAKVAGRYRGQISAYEVWNEPNGAQFFAPSPDPAGYTELLKAAYSSIKGADPAATVIGGVLGSVVDQGVTTVDPVRFLQQMYLDGARDFMDALSFHPYQYTLKFSDGASIANSPLNQTIAMRELMIANGDAGKKIWATEYGEPSTSTDDAGQAAFIADFLTKWPEMPYAGPIMIHTTRDRLTGSGDPEDVFGVYRSDWSPKPAAQAVKDRIAQGAPRSAEYERFSAVTDLTYGDVLSPVYRATPTVWAQRRTAATVYETPTGMMSSPNPVADKASRYGLVPTTPFADGYQDTDSPAGVRIWWSAATGAHAAGRGIVEAWTPRLGLAMSDEEPQTSGVKVQFEHGYITWQQDTGATVHLI
ncbi:cellulase family glycosylhydrolase [Mycobacterium yunnanensis]|uniref:Cellulase family glycosylhydrolase n=1 Tax=Mycobacterium yunnanensis TaxID=368477 RepID=A0A9X2YM89_9MYCO|nr:cellulase family glycosylhydrolase [Mycobacterium yunnanensis]MCV7421978.1 cellulase family glycosylhydrolase [Mycobacterium yunnanensis]